MQIYLRNDFGSGSDKAKGKTLIFSIGSDKRGDMMDHRLIYRNMERRRKVRKLSKKDVADIMGLSYSSYQRAMRNPKEFRLGELMAFCDYCGIGLKELLKY